MAAPSSLDRMVTALVPSLSTSLAEQFNVFRVMHHGTHEKQLSNVFAWLLRAEGTHHLGEAFQRIFVEQVVTSSGLAGLVLPLSGYRVAQEVDTSGREALGRDIADIVLTADDACLVVENFESSAGHGHDYFGYLAHGETGGRRSVVVLLCARHEPSRQTDGWEQAVVVTYADLLTGLRRHIERDTAWRRANPRQFAFLGELIDHFVEGASGVDIEDRISFIKAMCETGESARYGYRPQDAAAEEFADLLARHAKRQFEDGRETLKQVKSALRRHAEYALRAQLNEAWEVGHVTSVDARFVGQWEWCVTLTRDAPAPSVFLEFGPTAVVENERAPHPLPSPDYSKIFVTRQAADHDGIDRIVQTDVGLDDVLAGLPAGDTRLLDAVIGAA